MIKKTKSRVLKKVLHHRDHKLRKKTAFLPISEGFESTWIAILHDAEKNITKFLMYESDRVTAKIEVEIHKELKEDPNGFRRKINQVKNKHAKFCKLLEKRRS